MNVFGFDVPPHVEEACLARMRAADFHGDDLVRVLCQATDSQEALQRKYQIASRLIQRERRAGNIMSVRRGWWQWTAEKGGGNG